MKTLPRSPFRVTASLGTIAGAILLVGAFAPPLNAQPAISAAAGAASYDLAGVGTSGVGALRFEWPLLSRLDGQVGSSFFWYGSQGDDQVAMLLPEAGLLVRPSRALPVLVGAGAGRSLGVKGANDDDLTLYGALALDLEDRGGWAIRPEMRVRAVDPWAGTVAEFTLGVRRRFGS